MDPHRLENAIALAHHATSGGIGTLREKSLHAVLKYYFEPDVQYHEVKIGRYVVDLVTPDGIIEIQTAGLATMKKKLTTLLDLPHVSEAHPVTVIHPIIHTKRLSWVDPQTGEVSGGRRSPKKGSFYDAFYEIYALNEFLSHPHFRLCLLLYDGEEVRSLTGWSADKKRGSSRVNRIPTTLLECYTLTSPSDCVNLLPPGLPAPFTRKDFILQTRLRSPRIIWAGLKLLSTLGMIAVVGKQGNTLLYQRVAPQKNECEESPPTNQTKDGSSC